MNILVVKPSSFGDIIHTFPAVALLRRHFPEACISWVVNSEYAGLVELLSIVDDVIVFDRQRWRQWRNWGEVPAFIRQLRQRPFDLVLDFQGLLRSGLISYFSGGRRRVGFRSAREGAGMFYTEKVPLPANLKHAVRKNVFLVQSALNIPESDFLPELGGQYDFCKQAQKLCQTHGLDPGKPVLAVAPSTRWESKTWPLDFFARILDQLQGRCPDLQCWLVGTSGERPVGEQLATICQKARPVNLMGTTNYGTLVELLRLSNALLCNDSGPMHLAAALGVPTVALFGPTDSELTGPFGAGHIVHQGRCEMAPCFMRQCPKGDRECVDSVSEEGVIEDLLERLSGLAPAKRANEPAS